MSTRVRDQRMNRRNQLCGHGLRVEQHESHKEKKNAKYTKKIHTQNILVQKKKVRFRVYIS